MTEEVVNEAEKTLSPEKPLGEEGAAADGDKEAATDKVEEKEPEDKVKDYMLMYKIAAIILIEACYRVFSY